MDLVPEEEFAEEVIAPGDVIEIEAPAAADNNVNNNDDVRMVEAPTTSLVPIVAGSPNLENEPSTSVGCSRCAKRKFTNNEEEGGANSNDESDGGSTCPICLDDWELSGDHRLVSLKCGHLFGESCIKRWINGNELKKNKLCPQCKAPAQIRDIRLIYAKRLRVVDRTELHRLRSELNKIQGDFKTLHSNYDSLKFLDKMNRNKIVSLKNENDTLRQRYDVKENSIISNICYNYRLSLERTVEIFNDAKCRVLVYNNITQNLILSCKSNLPLFPGYGVRFLDLETSTLLSYMSVSSKSVRDMNINLQGNLLITASQDSKAKMFDLRNNSVVATYEPSVVPVWSCAFGQASKENYMYLGTQTGETFIYDIRSSKHCIHESQLVGDKSTIINIVHVNGTEHFPKGFILVCKLHSLWFYGYARTGLASTQLNIEGPFISMDYNKYSNLLLVVTRNNAKLSHSKFVLGSIEDVFGSPTFNVLLSMHGSKVSPVMNRCTHFPINNNNLIAGYLQDRRALALIDSSKQSYVQTLPITDIVFDLCSIKSNDSTYLVALTESKCRFFNVMPT